MKPKSFKNEKGETVYDVHKFSEIVVPVENCKVIAKSGDMEWWMNEKQDPKAPLRSVVNDIYTCEMLFGKIKKKRLASIHTDLCEYIILRK